MLIMSNRVGWPVDQKHHSQILELNFEIDWDKIGLCEHIMIPQDEENFQMISGPKLESTNQMLELAHFSEI